MVVIPIGAVNQAVLRAVDYARSHSSDVRAVIVDMEKEETARIEMQWAQWGCGVPLIVIPSRDGSLIRSLVGYIEELLDKDDATVSVKRGAILCTVRYSSRTTRQLELVLSGICPAQVGASITKDYTCYIDSARK